MLNTRVSPHHTGAPRASGWALKASRPPFQASQAPPRLLNRRQQGDGQPPAGPPATPEVNGARSRPSSAPAPPRPPPSTPTRPPPSAQSPARTPGASPPVTSTRPSPAPGGVPKEAELGCTHFSRCSGCTLENALGRPPLLARARALFRTLNWQEPLAADVGPVHDWRCRAKLAVHEGPRGLPVLGLYKEGTHDVVAIPRCRIHHPRINQAVELVSQMTKQLGVPLQRHSGGGSGRDQQGDKLQYLQLTAVARGGAAGARAEDDNLAQVQLVLVWGAADATGAAFAHCQRLCQALWTYGGSPAASGFPPTTRPGPPALLHSIWVNFNAPGPAGNAVLGAGWKLMHGPADAWQQFGSARVCLAPGSFVQANYGAMQLALRHMVDHIPAGSRLVELHAGVGVIGLAAAAAGKLSSLRCVEVNPACAAPFAASRALLDPLLHVEFVVAAAGSRPAAFIGDADVLVMDPPRKGLEAELLAELTRPLSGTDTSGTPTAASDAESPDARTGGGAGGGSAGPHTLLYLSCGFDALERDLRALLASGRWRLAAARAMLFFPGTDSLETLVVLRSVVQRETAVVVPAGL